MGYKKNRKVGFCIIAVIYILAVIMGTIIFMVTRDFSLLLRVLAADISATFFVYFASIQFKNSSVYDPYWSVAPIIIMVLLTVYLKVYNIGVIFLLVVINYWGIRLTWNWIITFKNLETQDWRYDMLKAKNPRIYQLINFAGIHMMPTLIVFGVIVPAIVYIQSASINYLTIIGFISCIAATTLQLFADMQMQEFRRTNRDKSRIIDIGLWKHSRHPNYFGEIIMWWGVYGIMLSTNINKWYLFIGPFMNTLLFVYISIPMAEKRLSSYKADFEMYKAQTRVLFPLPMTKKNLGLKQDAMIE